MALVLPARLLCAVVFLGLATWARPSSLPIPTADQVDRIAAFLPEKPTGVGQPITNRPAWEEAPRQPAFQKQLKDAEQFASEPIPELNADELFALEMKTGRRDVYEKPFRQRTTRLVAFTVAECIRNDGAYLPFIEAELRAILAEKTWGVSPQVDEHPYGGFEGIVDLASSARAWNLATVYYWLGDKLKPDLRQAIREALHRRIFQNYEASVRSGKPFWWWMTANTNWNPVCTSGVLGAALAVIDSRKERALFVQAALNSLSFYSEGFPEDGYCQEGISYWSYGFGCYLCAAETLYQASQGRINLFDGPRLRKMALFLPRLRIVPGVFPAFGDAYPRMREMPGSLMKLINRRWNMGWPAGDPAQEDMFRGHPLGDRLFGFGLFGFPWPTYREPMYCLGVPVPFFDQELPAGSPPMAGEVEGEALRCYFPQASVLVCRSTGEGRVPFGLALKGGKNGGPHSHIDNGSYVVAYGDVPLIADPGMEDYTTKTFGPHRFESMMMNSYGHSVPFVGKALQKSGPESEGKIIETQFTESRDTLRMDLTSGYAVPGLRRLTRTFIFDRVRPSVEVIDEADFEGPTDFGSAVVTLSKWREDGPGSFLVYEKDLALQVTSTVEGADVSLVNQVEPITGFRLIKGITPIRLGVNLSAPVTHLALHTLIVPGVLPADH